MELHILHKMALPRFGNKNGQYENLKNINVYLYGVLPYHMISYRVIKVLFKANRIKSYIYMYLQDSFS